MNCNVTHLCRRRPRVASPGCRRALAIALVLGSVLLFDRPAEAVSYECVAPSGGVIYTDSPEPEEKCSAIELLATAPPKGIDPSIQGMDEPVWQPPLPRAIMPDGDVADEPYAQPGNIDLQDLSPVNMSPRD